MAIGDFSPSYLAEVQVRQDNVFAQGRQKHELTYPLTSLRGILDRQNVRFDPVLLGDRCIGMKADWLKDCQAPSDADPTDADCDITGQPIESVMTPYEPNFAEIETFRVTDDECKDVYTAQDKIAYNLATKKVKLARKVAQRIIAFLGANAQVNAWTDAPDINENGTTYEFLGLDENPDFFARLHLLATLNRFENYYMISGNSFWEANWNALYNLRNDDQRDQSPKLMTMNPIWDPLNFADLSIPNNLYLLETGSMGAFFKNEYLNLSPIEQTSDKFVWREPLMDIVWNNGGSRLPIYVDMRMNQDCVVLEGANRNSTKKGWSFEMIVEGGIHLGPEDCDSGTGILEFQKVTEFTEAE